MQLPILAYGHRILREKCLEIKNSHLNLETLIKDMWETMHYASGCGLAAPQIGQAIRLFIVDSKTTYERLEEEDRANYFAPGDEGIRETFINAKIIHSSESTWQNEEGCLSIPGLVRQVNRSWSITIEYLDPAFNHQTKTFSGATARMIQHEYDHMEGILYLDHLNSLTKKLLHSKLRKIVKGQIKPRYPMKFV